MYLAICILEDFLLLQNRETLLHIASKRGDAKVIKILTRSGANTNIKNNVRKSYDIHTYVVTFV